MKGANAELQKIERHGLSNSRSETGRLEGFYVSNV